MNIVQALLRDHQAFYNQFDRLEENLRGPAREEEIKSQLTRLEAALGAHAKLEDELLFVTLEPFIGEAGPLGVMRMEHEEIERTLGQFQGAADIAETRELVAHLLEVARPHFMKEEQILFPMSDQVLSPEELDELGRQYENRRP